MLVRVLSLFALLSLPVWAQGNWKLVWSDEFDGASIDRNKWDYDTGWNGGWGNNELEYYTSRAENSYLEDGKLVIKAMREDYQGRQYTSARMVTRGKYSVTYGRIEALIQIPYSQGIWPAFWMLGDDISTIGWPKCGEIDIMEVVGKEPRNAYGTAHMPRTDGGSGSVSQGGKHTLPASGPAIHEAYHRFAVEWEPEEIRWYFDDVLYKTFRKSETPANGTWVFNKPFHLLLNVAVGGNWPGYPDASTALPQFMRVDYVRVYQREKPAVPAGGVVNGASFAQGIAPGSWATVFGTGLAGTTRAWWSGDFHDGNAPTELEGTSVLVGGKPAYIGYVSPTQINFQVPDAGAGPVSVEVVRNGERSDAVTAQSDPYSPAFFLWAGRYVVATDLQFNSLSKPGLFPNVVTHPAAPGQGIILWGTGFGPVDPPVPPGRLPQIVGVITTPHTVRIGGLQARHTTEGSAMSPGLVGVYQIYAEVPAGLTDGDHPVVIDIGGKSSPETAFLTVAR